MKMVIFACAAGIGLAACGDKNTPSIQPVAATNQVKPEAATTPPAPLERSPVIQDPSGVPKKEVALCAAEANTVKRLECYDHLAARHDQAPSTKISDSTNKGKWQVETDTDPLTDKSIHYAFLTADSGSGRFGDSIGLTIRCKDKRTEAYINWNTFLGTDGITVTSRIDKEPAKTIRWSTSTDHKASFMPNAALTVKGFIGAESYIANLTPYGESPITAIFDITGAEQALSDIKKGCNWKS